jgi:hypothetical protein
MIKLNKNESNRSSKFGACTRNYTRKFPDCSSPLGFIASATCKLPSDIHAGHGFESFYVALNNKCSITLTTSSRVQSLSLVLCFYISMSVALSTYFSQHLSGITSMTTYPAFLNYYIIQVTNSVHSRLKNGSLVGSTVFDYTPLDHFKAIERSMGFEKDENGRFVSYSLTNGLENTPLSALHISDLVKVRDYVERFSASISEGTSPQVCEKVLEMYRMLNLAFHPKSRLLMTDDVSFNKVSSSLGIFRYHRYNDKWIANCYSLESVHEHGIGMQYSFLGLFNPDISYKIVESTSALSREPQPGDRVIDLSNISGIDYWETIMSGGEPRPDKSKKVDRVIHGNASKKENGIKSYSTYSKQSSSFSSVYYNRLGETVYFTLERDNAVLLHSQAYIYY